MDLKEYLDQQLDLARRDWQELVSRINEYNEGIGTARFNWEANAIRQRMNMLNMHKRLYCLKLSDEEAR